MGDTDDAEQGMDTKVLLKSDLTKEELNDIAIIERNRKGIYRWPAPDAKKHDKTYPCVTLPLGKTFSSNSQIRITADFVSRQRYGMSVSLNSRLPDNNDDEDNTVLQLDWESKCEGMSKSEDTLKFSCNRGGQRFHTGKYDFTEVIGQVAAGRYTVEFARSPSDEKLCWIGIYKHGGEPRWIKHYSDGSEEWDTVSMVVCNDGRSEGDNSLEGKPLIYGVEFGYDNPSLAATLF